MIVVIDNYDSFTYNLVQYLGELGAELQVFRNDQVAVKDIEALQPTHIVISPGPGTPEGCKRSVGISNDVIRRFHQGVSILGVCLGHQCIGYVFGGRVVRAPRLMHGKTSLVYRGDHPIFEGVPDQFRATRYHSLVVEEPLPEVLTPVARTEEGELMGLCHRNHPVIGLQFHPESILTREGKRILQNFLEMSSSPLPPRSSVGRGVAGRLSVEEAKRCPELVEGMNIKEGIGKVMLGEDLSGEEAEAVMGQIMAGEATPAQIGSFLTALRIKGETVDEIAGMATVMREKAVPVKITHPAIDVVGTGGDGSGSFNISTAAAFVVAGAGLKVAKHGNRAASSKCGSADVLEVLGVKLELSPENVARCIEDAGIGFMFAQVFHPAMKHVALPRREIGIRTVFNILGPLTNPARAEHMLLGVPSEELGATIASVLNRLGTKHSLVVHGQDGLDEISISSKSLVWDVSKELLSPPYEISPENFGFPKARRSEIAGGTPQENAVTLRGILNGVKGSIRNMVVMNAAAALVAGDVTNNLDDAARITEKAIDNGKAKEKLDKLVELSQQLE